MTTIPSRLLEIALALRPGSAERQIVLRATHQGMKNLLKASAKPPTPPAPPHKPTVLPAKPTMTPGVMHIIRQEGGGPAPAALPATLLTQAYVESGAAPPRPEVAADRPTEGATPFQGDGSRSFDFRNAAVPADARLPGALVPVGGGRDAGRAGKGGAPGGGDASEASPLERGALVALVGAALAVAAIVLVVAITR